MMWRYRMFACVTVALRDDAVHYVPTAVLLMTATVPVFFQRWYVHYTHFSAVPTLAIHWNDDALLTFVLTDGDVTLFCHSCSIGCDALYRRVPLIIFRVVIDSPLHLPQPFCSRIACLPIPADIAVALRCRLPVMSLKYSANMACCDCHLVLRIRYPWSDLLSDLAYIDNTTYLWLWLIFGYRYGLPRPDNVWLLWTPFLVSKPFLPLYPRPVPADPRRDHRHYRRAVFSTIDIRYLLFCRSPYVTCCGVFFILSFSDVIDVTAVLFVPEYFLRDVWWCLNRVIAFVFH